MSMYHAYGRCRIFSSEGAIKLCDFGCATTQSLSPDHSWSATQCGLAEDEVRETERETVTER